MNQAVMGAGATDRLSFTLFLALAIHAMIVFGISFTHEDPLPSPHTLEITLAQFDDGKKPEEADFLAQTNQQGSGTEDLSTPVSTTTPAPFQDSQIRETAQSEPLVTGQQPREPHKQFVVTSGNASVRAPISPPEEEEIEEPEDRPRPTLMERSLEIASLEAELAQKQRAYAKRPRVTRLTAASTMQTSDAYYMKSWLEKVERVGNLNYPEEARKKQIYGRLRLLVALYATGEVKEIRVLHSSGHKVLDDAAIRIVRLAAPFSPFPDDVRKERDILEIIRTWSFQEKGLSSY